MRGALRAHGAELDPGRSSGLLRVLRVYAVAGGRCSLGVSNRMAASALARAAMPGDVRGLAPSRR